MIILQYDVMRNHTWYQKLTDGRVSLAKWVARA